MNSNPISFFTSIRN